MKAYYKTITEGDLNQIYCFASVTFCLLIEVHVPSQESERSCICAFGVSILPHSSICLLYFGAVLVGWYFISFSI